MAPKRKAAVKPVQEAEPVPEKRTRKTKETKKVEPENVEIDAPAVKRKGQKAKDVEKTKKVEPENVETDAPAVKGKGQKAKDVEKTKKVEPENVETDAPAVKGKGQKAKDVEKTKKVEPENVETDALAVKRKGQKAKGVEKTKKATTTNAMNVTETKWQEIDFSCTKKNPKGKTFNQKITSWNVDGIRAWLKKDGNAIFEHDRPDILCLQETKCSESKLHEEVKEVEGYHAYWCCSDKEGYAGVGVYSKEEPLEVKYGIDDENHDAEGRCITLKYPKFFLINVYVPNAGRGLVTLPKRLKWNEAFKAYVKNLDEQKPVILCGDMNVAHNEIDLTNPKTNKKNAGFTQEERDGMTTFLEDGYIDSYRKLYPDEKNVYTFWSYMAKARAKNIGWRLDYFILSERIMDNICDHVVQSNVYGSDHCPITLFINI